MNRPNILIFMSDHQRGDSVLPETPTVTPNYDRMAREGVTFTNTFCPAPHCCPSRATFFSGLYPSRHGVWNNVGNGQAINRGLNEGVKLWSEDLADSGYDMHFMGKWHVSNLTHPEDHGWQTDQQPDYGASLEKHWEEYRHLAEQPEPRTRAEGEILRPGYGAYTLYSEGDEQQQGTELSGRAVQKIKDLSASDTPWCLYVGTLMPHDPYIVPQKYLDLYPLDEIELPPNWQDSLKDKPYIYRRMRDMRFGQLSEREVREAIRHFRALCTYIDDMLGDMLKALDETGQTENTLVMFCSDHGDYCGEHGLFAKGIPCFRGAYHVPMMMRWPDGIKNPGRRVDDFVSLADVAPSLLELTGQTAERYFTGDSLVPFLNDQTPEGWRDAVFTQCNGVELYYTQRSVMTKEWKYVFNGFDMDELYDLRSDPHEMRNLAEKPGYEDVKREMCRRLWQFAHDEKDNAVNRYITVSLAPYGPAEIFREC